MGDTQPDRQDDHRAARRSTGTHAGQEAAVQSVQRAILILKCFTREQPELGVTELSRQLGLHKSTVSRLVAALRHEGLVTQVPRNGKYRLGTEVVRLAGVALQSLKLPDLAEAPMQALVAEFEETVSLVIADDHRCVALRTVPSPRLVQVVKPSAWEISPLVSAAGQVLLAFDAATRRPPHPEVAPPRGPSQVPASPYPEDESCDAVLSGVREVGYAIVRGAWIPDLVEIAVPIWDHQTRVVGVLEMSGPAHRMDGAQVDAILPALRRAAARISGDLGSAKGRASTSATGSD